MEIDRLPNLIKNHRVIYFPLLPIIYVGRFFINKKETRFLKSYQSMMQGVEGGSLVVHVPDFRGTFEIDFRSHILIRILMNKSYEPRLVKLIDYHIDYQKDAIDVGANIGLFTVLLSKSISPGNKVLAIEPTPLALHYLKKNMNRNGCLDSVILFEGVAVDLNGNYKINVISGMEEYSSLGSITHPAVAGKPHQKINVVGDTIDNLVDCYDLTPGFIKIDAEGAEYLVLRGALHTIKKTAPVILSELDDDLLANFGASSQMVVDLLHDNGYEVRNANYEEHNITKPFRGEIIALPKIS